MLYRHETQTLRQVKTFIRQPYAWPGGYPLFLVLQDDAALCHDCTADNFRHIAQDVFDNVNTGWRPYRPEVNYEDADLYCDHCGERIESAYGETE